MNHTSQIPAGLAFRTGPTQILPAAGLDPTTGLRWVGPSLLDAREELQTKWRAMADELLATFRQLVLLEDESKLRGLPSTRELVYQAYVRASDTATYLKSLGEW